MEPRDRADYKFAQNTVKQNRELDRPTRHNRQTFKLLLHLVSRLLIIATMERIPEPELMDSPDEAQAYAQADFSQVNQAMANKICDISPNNGPCRALDMGTGPGDIPIRLARARPKWHITAIDAAPEMINLAQTAVRQARLEQSITLLVADAMDTGLAGAGFDIIFSNSLLHHVSRPDALWAELKRLAKPASAVLVRDLVRPPSPQAALNIVQTYAGNESPLLQEEYYRSLLAAYNVEEVRGQLARAGLGMLEVMMISDRHMEIQGVIV